MVDDGQNALRPVPVAQGMVPDASAPDAAVAEAVDETKKAALASAAIADAGAAGRTCR